MGIPCPLTNNNFAQKRGKTETSPKNISLRVPNKYFQICIDDPYPKVSLDTINWIFLHVGAEFQMSKQTFILL